MGLKDRMAALEKMKTALKQSGSIILTLEYSKDGQVVGFECGAQHYDEFHLYARGETAEEAVETAINLFKYEAEEKANRIKEEAEERMNALLAPFKTE